MGQPPTIEGVVAAIAQLPVAFGNTWYVETLVPSRLHISRAAGGESTLFIEGPLESFGKLPALPGTQHSGDIVSLPGGSRLAALRIVANDQIHGARAMAHIAYELVERLNRDPGSSNKDLLDAIRWVLPLLRANAQVMSHERQRGLVGECMLLSRLLNLARKAGVRPAGVVSRWLGPNQAKRDFAAKGIAIEAKTTAYATRRHHVSDLLQLEPQDPDEDMFLYSVGLRTDLSAPRKLLTYLRDVRELLCYPSGAQDDEAVALFNAKLRAYGFDWADESLYENEPGLLAPHLKAQLFRVKDLDRLTMASFVGGKLPTMVVSVAYDIEIASEPLSEDDSDEVMRRLLSAAPLA